MRPKMRHHRPSVQLCPFARFHSHLDVLPGDRVGDADDLRTQHIRVEKSDTLHLTRQDLETTDVEYLLRTPHNLYIVAFLVDDVPRVVPSIHEWRRSIQVAEHPVRRPDVQNTILDFRLDSLPADLHPQTVARLRLHLENAELREPVSLPEVDVRELRAKAVERSLVHALGPVRDHAQIRELHRVEYAGEKHHPQKRRSRRKTL